MDKITVRAPAPKNRKEAWLAVEAYWLAMLGGSGKRISKRELPRMMAPFVHEWRPNSRKAKVYCLKTGDFVWINPTAPILGERLYMRYRYVDEHLAERQRTVFRTVVPSKVTRYMIEGNPVAEREKCMALYTDLSSVTTDYFTGERSYRTGWGHIDPSQRYVEMAYASKAYQEWYFTELGMVP